MRMAGKLTVWKVIDNIDMKSNKSAFVCYHPVQWIVKEQKIMWLPQANEGLTKGHRMCI